MSLAGKTILVTRRHEQAKDLVAEIEKRSGRAVVIPMIHITDPENWNECDTSIDAIGVYDAIIFTSTNAVAKFFQRLGDRRINLSGLANVDVYAVGEKTKVEVENRGVAVKYVPEYFSSAALSEFFAGKDVKGKRFLLPKGNLNKEDLKNSLVARGAVVDAVTVYQNMPPDDASAKELKRRVLGSEFDVVTFASPSAAKNFSDVVSPGIFENVQSKTKIAVIGSTTCEAVKNLDFQVDIEAQESTNAGLAKAIDIYYSETPNL